MAKPQTTRDVKGASDLVLQHGSGKRLAKGRSLRLVARGTEFSMTRVPRPRRWRRCAGRVSLVKPPIVRGTDERQVVLIRGEVELD